MESPPANWITSPGSLSLTGRTKSMETPDPKEPKSTGLTAEEQQQQEEEEEEEKEEEEEEEVEEEEDRLERLVMDFDDLDDSWPLDQILLLSNGNNNDSPSSMSPFYLSCSDQPVSPLLAFVDGGDNAVHAASASPDSSLLLSRSPNFISEMPMENVNNRRFPSPFMGLKPLDDLDGYCVIKERMTQALRYFKDLTEQNVLAQVWAPTKYGGRDVLTTSGQPFVLGPHSNGLHQFRMISLGFMFPVDEEKDGVPGLPGRVFQQRLPEWTPNVQYYSNKEYPRRDHAEHYNVQGSLALPVFDPSGRSCVGVLELIMTSPKIHYAPEVDKVCKALEAVNLKSSEILDKPHIQICNEGRQNALAEILGILTEVCETHKLPLAQTWVPCMHRSVLAHGGGLRKNCTSFDGVCMEQVCMSTTDVALYVVDARMCGFREACVEHHLQKGQGVAGRAFSSHGLCFCGNITRFCKTEYPLVHYARMFGLASCFAICLRSTFTGDDDYIPELFLPPSITDFYEQQILLESLLATMKGHFQSLRVASGIELDKEVSVEIIQVSADERVDSRLGSLRVPISMKSPTRPEGLLNNGDTVQLKSSQQQLMLHSNGIHDKGATAKNGVGSINHFSLENKEMKKTSERKRGKTEKSISLEVLQQYFAGSLKDAAKSLGVCPTTMKRICRQHGISRWPSRKINKVNRSLSKLKRVIESVQGAEGAFGLDSITPSPGPVPVAVDSQPSRLNRSSPQTSPTSKLSEPQKNNELLAGRPLKNDEEVGNQEEDQLHRQRLLSPKNDIRDHSRSTSEPGKGSNRSKTRSGSCEESAGTPTSHGSCQGTPLNGSTMPKNQNVSSVNEQCIEVARSPGLAYEPPGEPCISASYLIPNTLLMPETQETFGGMLIEDAGSSKDLRNLCPAVADAMLEEQLPELSGTNPPRPSTAPNQPMAPPVHTTPHVIARNEMKSVTIKATYREDIIRFRISLSSGIMELKEEVAKRLKLEIGTFDIKYLDDDQEWVLIACDADMQECMDISRSSASNIIRLLVQDAMVNLGSSCESSG